jgi:DNA-binding transcriptional ArsR family regulator
MAQTPDISPIAAAVADPTRGRMLMALMAGRALTATELALDGGVSPSTASSHLARLSEAGLVSMARQGRHRYFRIARPEVAAMLEGMISVADARGSARTTGPRDPAMRRARVCYDHLAGEAAVQLLDQLRTHDIVIGDDDALTTGTNAARWAAGFGIDLDQLRSGRRSLCRPCLDWSERRSHLAGALGAAILDRLISLRYARRDTGTRVLSLSPNGLRFISRPDLVGARTTRTRI